MSKKEMAGGTQKPEQPQPPPQPKKPTEDR